AAGAAQRVRRVAVAGRAQADAPGVPVQHLVPQAHRMLVRDQRFDGGAVDPDHRLPPGPGTGPRLLPTPRSMAMHAGGKRVRGAMALMPLPPDPHRIRPTAPAPPAAPARS